MGAFAWTDDVVERLRSLHAEGLSCSRIAAAIGAPSRNSVISKVHRLGLAGRVQTSKPASIPKPKVQREAPAPPPARKAASNLERMAGFEAMADKAMERFDEAVTAARPDEDTGVRFLDRGLFQCAMPLPGWDDLSVIEKRVCGRQVKIRPDGSVSSYCAACSRVVYAPERLREYRDSQAVRGLAA